MKLSKILTKFAVILAVGAGAMYNSHLENTPILPEAFDNLIWPVVDIDNIHTLKNFYNKENIPHNDHNWEVYLRKYREMNELGENEPVGGYRAVPDLDKNGYPDL